MFDFELNFIISDHEKFSNAAKATGAEIIKRYKSTDIYYKPKDHNFKKYTALRIRNNQNIKIPSKIILSDVEIIYHSKISFTKSIHNKGKILLFEGEFKLCASILKKLGFKKYFVVKKDNGESWISKRNNIAVGCEYIHGIGYIGEIEYTGKTEKQFIKYINNCIKLLQIDKKDIIVKQDILATLSE